MASALITNSINILYPTNKDALMDEMPALLRVVDAYPVVSENTVKTGRTVMSMNSSIFSFLSTRT